MPKFPPRLSIGKTSTSIALACLIIFLALNVVAQPQNQTDWRQWTGSDVHKILYDSPWVARCCREWDTGPYSEGGPPDLGRAASIVSSLTVRQALARRIVLDKRYAKLDLAAREDVDRRIVTCLNEQFDDYIVVSFSFSFSDRSGVYPMKAFPEQIYLIASDGQKIPGQVVTDSIAMKCGATSDAALPINGARSIEILQLFGPEHELAFPRYVNGKPTIKPDDKEIRIGMDFFTKVVSYRSVGELDFNLAKLTYQGKPDF